MFHISSLKCFW